MERNFFRDMICEDGLHLTEEGQMFVGEQIADLARIEDENKKS